MIESMNTRLPLIAAVVILVVAAGAVGFLLMHPAAPLPSTPAPAATTTQPMVLDDQGQYYEIMASYPGKVALSADASASAQANARAVLSAWVQETVATFKANSGLDTLTPEDIRIQGLDQGRKYALDIKYTEHDDANTVTYLFEVFEDTLGAHPNAYYRSFTFNTTTGQELRIADLFSGSGYLNTLSRISREKLTPQIAKATETPLDEFDTTYLESGTTPDANNFQVFYFEDSNLVIVFPPYQVGPWVLGTQTISIPRSDLSVDLKAEYR